MTLSPFALLHVGESVVATIALDDDKAAPPIILWRLDTREPHRVFIQTYRNPESWRYDEIDALVIN